MKDIKLAVYFIILGASLIAYGHSNFTTKDASEKIYDMVKETRDMVTNIHIHYKGK